MESCVTVGLYCDQSKIKTATFVGGVYVYMYACTVPHNYASPASMF